MKAWVDPEFEPDIENIVDLLPVIAGARAEEALAGADRVPGIGAFVGEGFDDALVDVLVFQNFDAAVAVLAHEHGDRHAPGALARDHPIGLALDHSANAVLALRRHPAGDRDRIEGAITKSIPGVLIDKFRPIFVRRNKSRSALI